ncbi:Protein of unknown function (DUF4280) (plasmid) [Paraburkholderia caribensis MBA4]|uniref:DUF4280 domain-containing protein n=1 Tax=Paraburkholderia caribensis MBA4 TaxID=1323664 RepID=A0A0P0RQA2_9BURK|nr:DUF4280 domain-containing protein [Paraburkholderia caribensis]ALL70961.1 Protein of unknown function (DUF4280) [Paraburkholderia caribensis MBA4]
MPQQVTMGAMLQCTFGLTPATLTVLPVNRVMVEGPPAATIQDHMPLVNIGTFGMCSSPANPVVISATAAKLGVFTPMPCIPATMTPWAAGAPTVVIGGIPALDNVSQCMCMWGGVVTVVNPATVRTEVP